MTGNLTFSAWKVALGERHNSKIIILICMVNRNENIFQQSLVARSLIRGLSVQAQGVIRRCL